MTKTFIHNIHPSFADEQNRRALLASFGSQPFNDDAAFARLKQQVDGLKGSLSTIPERVESAMEKAMRPLLVEAALREREQATINRYIAPATEDFSDIDLNAMMNEGAA